MQTWNNCEATTLYYDNTPADSYGCEVRIDGKNIVVSYMEVENPVSIIYKGKEVGSGHYELVREDAKGHATLHRIKNSIFFGRVLA